MFAYTGNAADLFKWLLYVQEEDCPLYKLINVCVGACVCTDTNLCGSVRLRTACELRGDGLSFGISFCL